CAWRRNSGQSCGSREEREVNGPVPARFEGVATTTRLGDASRVSHARGNSPSSPQPRAAAELRTYPARPVTGWADPRSTLPALRRRAARQRDTVHAGRAATT